MNSKNFFLNVDLIYWSIISKFGFNLAIQRNDLMHRVIDSPQPQSSKSQIIFFQCREISNILPIYQLRAQVRLVMPKPDPNLFMTFL